MKSISMLAFLIASGTAFAAGAMPTFSCRTQSGVGAPQIRLLISLENYILDTRYITESRHVRMRRNQYGAAFVAVYDNDKLIESIAGTYAAEYAEATLHGHPWLNHIKSWPLWNISVAEKEGAKVKRLRIVDQVIYSEGQPRTVVDFAADKNRPTLMRLHCSNAGSQGN